VFLVLFWLAMLSLSFSLIVLVANFFLGLSPQRLASTDWAGYVVVSDYVNPQPTIAGVSGSWVVPTVTAFSNDRFSAAWIGIGGQVDFDTTLIQVGTEHDSVDGEAVYSAWYELLPNLSVNIASMTINPGDRIAASITLTDSIANKWSVEMIDITTHNRFNEFFFYNSSKLSAEWIVERPSINNSLSLLADFGTITFTNTTAINNVTTGSINELDFASITMYNRQNIQLVSVSSLTSNGDSFTVKYLDNSSMSTQFDKLFESICTVSTQKKEKGAV